LKFVGILFLAFSAKRKVEVLSSVLYHLFMQNSKNLLLGVTSLVLASLASCQNEGATTPIRMPFGKLYESEASLSTNLQKITWSTLSGMLTDKSTFVLLIALDPDSTCTCFSYLRDGLTTYLAASNAYIYTIAPSEFDGSGKSTFDLKISGTEGNETLAIFEDGGIKYQRQRAGQDDSWTKDATAFSEWMSARISVPDMLYVSTSQLAALPKDTPYVRAFFWASCPDCQYVSANFLKTYNLTSHTQWYVFDCDVEGVRLLNGVKADKKADPTSTAGLAWIQYQLFMAKYGISKDGDADYGYGRGYVPCFQFVSNGEVADMDVYVNDAPLANSDGTYTLSGTYEDSYIKALSQTCSRTYWDGTRSHEFFNYLDKSVVTDFTKEAALQAIPASDIEDGGWKHSAAAKYHDPLLKGFLDHYLAK
jgi:hypothetical protein